MTKKTDLKTEGEVKKDMPIKVELSGRSEKISYQVCRLKRDGFFPEFIYQVEYEESKKGMVISLGEQTIKEAVSHTGEGYAIQVFQHGLLEYINPENETWGYSLVAHYINGNPVIRNDGLIKLLLKTDLPEKVKKAMGEV